MSWFIVARDDREGISCYTQIMTNSPAITLLEAEKIAKLARLDLSQDEIAKYAGQLSAILGYIKQLQEVKTENVPMTSQVTGLSNVLRDDAAASCADAEELVRMAPASENNLIKVKAVFE